jgi:hypothetical protein
LLANRFLLEGELDFGRDRFCNNKRLPIVRRDGELAEDQEEHVGDDIWYNAVDGGLECFAMSFDGGG